MTRLAASKITASATVGKLLVDFSHTGENAGDRVNDPLHPARVTAIRTGDADNTVAVVCDGVEYGIGAGGWVEVL